MAVLVDTLVVNSDGSSTGGTLDTAAGGNIVIGHANFPAVTRVYDDIIRLIQAVG